MQLNCVRSIKLYLKLSKILFSGENAYHLFRVALRKADKQHVVRELDEVQLGDVCPTEGKEISYLSTVL